MTTTLTPGAKPRQAPDERVARRSLLSRLLSRPEVGALLGAIVIYLVFFAVAPPFRELTSLSSVLARGHSPYPVKASLTMPAPGAHPPAPVRCSSVRIPAARVT